jgi:hypothetical protein
MGPPLGPTQSPVQWVQGLKRPGRESDHLPSSPRGQENMDLYMYTSISLHGVVLNLLSIGNFTFFNLCCQTAFKSFTDQDCGNHCPIVGIIVLGRAVLKLSIRIQAIVFSYKGLQNRGGKVTNGIIIIKNEVPINEQNSLTVTREHSAGSSQSPICRR